MITFQKKTDESQDQFLNRIQFATNPRDGERLMRDASYREAVDRQFSRIHGSGDAGTVVEPPIRTEHDTM